MYLSKGCLVMIAVTTFVIKVVVFQLVVGLDESAPVFPAMARARSPGCLTKMKSYREAIRPP